MTTEIVTYLDEEEAARKQRRNELRQALIAELGTIFTNVDRTRLNLRIDTLNELETVVLATFHGRNYRIVRRVSEVPFAATLPPKYFVELPGGRGVAVSSPTDIPAAIVRCHIFAEWRDAQATP